MAAIYQADTWCDSCAEEIKQRIQKQGNTPENIDDETTYDSDEFPKFMSENESADCPQHCGSGKECLEAETMPSGEKIGKLLSCELTNDGIEYVKEYILEGGEISNWWRQQFEEAGYDFELPE